MRNSQFLIHSSQINILRLVLLGPPGSGKGTQAEWVSRQFNIVRISTGDLLREGIQQGTALGKKAKEFVEKGRLVPDSLMLDLIRDRLDHLKDGFILDGFPRTLVQGEGLEKILKEKNTRLTGVLFLEVREKTLLQRLTERRICSQCGTLYNLSTSPPRQEGKCDRCGGFLVQREDDRKETIKRRLTVYERETAPLKEFYREKGALFPVEGEGGIQEVTKHLQKKIMGLMEKRSSS